MALSEETKKTLDQFVRTLGTLVSVLPVTGAETAGTILQALPEGLLVKAAELVGIHETRLVESLEATLEVDLRTDP